MVAVRFPSNNTSSLMVMLTLAKVAPTGMVTVSGTVTSLVSLLERLMVKGVSVGVLRVMVALTVPGPSVTERGGIFRVSVA